VVLRECGVQKIAFLEIGSEGEFRWLQPKLAIRKLEITKGKFEQAGSLKVGGPKAGTLERLMSLNCTGGLAGNDMTYEIHAGSKKLDVLNGKKMILHAEVAYEK
jgi:hypothetical protein